MAGGDIVEAETSPAPRFHIAPPGSLSVGWMGGQRAAQWAGDKETREIRICEPSGIDMGALHQDLCRFLVYLYGMECVVCGEWDECNV